jgi:hypothetical protein
VANIEHQDRAYDPVQSAARLLVIECHVAAASAGWWTDPAGESLCNAFGEKPKVNIGEKLALIHSELGEALEGDRTGAPDKHIPEFDSFTVELADAAIRIFDTAGGLSLRLPEAIVAKLRYNPTRSDHKKENRDKPGGKKY